MVRVVFDCERMKYPDTGLYHYCLNLGRHLEKNINLNKEQLLLYTPPGEQRWSFHSGNHITQNPLHKFILPPLNGYDIWHSTYQNTHYMPLLNRKIKVVLSKGGEKATVPQLKGMSYRQAELALDNRGLKIGLPVYISVDSLPRDEVIASFPSAGTVVPLGMEIRVVVNQEQTDTLEIVKVPKFKGDNIREVSSKIEKLGLKLGKIEYKVKNKLLPGTVLKQIPKEGAEVRKGSIVELEVSTTD
mgnify:CR=1 FL=1